MHIRLKGFSFCGYSVDYAGKIRGTNGSMHDALIVNESSRHCDKAKQVLCYLTKRCLQTIRYLQTFAIRQRAKITQMQ